MNGIEELGVLKAGGFRRAKGQRLARFAKKAMDSASLITRECATPELKGFATWPLRPRTTY